MKLPPSAETRDAKAANVAAMNAKDFILNDSGLVCVLRVEVV